MRVRLTWQDASGNEDGFRIFKDGGSGWQQYAQVAPGVVSILDTSVVSGGIYSYKVQAFNAYGTADSNIVSVTVENPIPNAPENLVAVVEYV